MPEAAEEVAEAVVDAARVVARDVDVAVVAVAVTVVATLEEALHAVIVPPEADSTPTTPVLSLHSVRKESSTDQPTLHTCSTSRSAIAVNRFWRLLNYVQRKMGSLLRDEMKSCVLEYRT